MLPPGTGGVLGRWTIGTREQQKLTAVSRRFHANFTTEGWPISKYGSA
jgi:hypothetical protein